MPGKKSTFGVKGMFNLYSWYDFFKSLKYPLPIAVVSFVIFAYYGESYFKAISDTVGLAISIIPTLIGFTLAGYALLVGFGNKEFLMFLSKEREGKPTTLYQDINTVFAFSILFQLIFLIIASFIYFIVRLNLQVSFLSELGVDIINLITLFILLFGFFYSLFAVRDMVANVFSFGQMHHYKIKKDIAERERNEAAVNNRN